MKKWLFLVLALWMALLTAACGDLLAGGSSSQAASSGAPAPAVSSEPTEPVEKTELVVFAAASLTETLEQIADLYAAVEPNVTLTFNFDSSGTLKTQIQEGANCDLFLSAGQKQIDQLDLAAPDTVNTEKLDFVKGDTRVNLLENRVVLVAATDHPQNISRFDDLPASLTGKTILLAIGNTDVPVGQYAQNILTYYGLDEQTLTQSGVLSYGTNVKEITTQLAEASVDYGVIYCTDAYSAGLPILDYATAEMCGRVIYPAAVLKTSQNEQAARAFLDYLASAQAMAVFETVGFSKP